MTRRDALELVGLVLLTGGVGWLSLPWACIVLGALIVAACVAGRLAQCSRQ